MIRTTILINSVEIDLLEDIAQSYTYAIADIRTPEKRDSSHSKTLRIPGSPANNKLFTHIFEIGNFVQTSGTTNFDPDYNPNLKADALVFVDSILVMKGILKLDSIDITDTQEIYYNCTIWGKVANIFANLLDKKVQDLDWSDLDHTYNRTVQKASWTAAVGEGYIYSMIDYGRNNATQFKVNDFFPGVYLKEYVDRIFSEAGFVYDSAFFDTTYFKSLYIPFNGDKLLLTSAQLDARKFRASRTSTQSDTNAVGTTAPTLTVTDTVIFTDDSTSPNEDPGAQYNTGTGEFTATNAGKYTFTGDLKVRYVLTPSVSATSTLNITTSVFAYVNGSPYGAISSSYYYYAPSGAFTSHTTPTQTIYFSGNSIQLNAGDVVTFRVYTFAQAAGQGGKFYLDGGGSPVTGNIDMETLAGSYVAGRQDNIGIAEGDTVDMSGTVPVDLKCSDLLISIIKTFNLYVDVDKSVDNKLLIEPYTDFYTSGVTLDWTDKLDISSQMKIEPMGLLDAKRYLWKFKDDADYYNKKYKDRWNETYGQHFLDVNNDWLKGEKKNEVIFSPTPLVEVTGTDRIISRIFSVDANNVVSPKVSNIRLLYYGGVKNTNFPWQYITASTTFTETTYPYGGHLDDVYSPTKDINFGVPREVYYVITSGSNYTDDNIFNGFHKQFIDEVTDRNSKLLTGLFHLTAADIHQLDFRNTIRVDGHLYYLNKVIDYNPVVDGLTSVELLKRRAGIPFSRTVAQMSGAYAALGTGLTPTIHFGSDAWDTVTPEGGSYESLRNSEGNRYGNYTSGVIIESSERCSIGDGAERCSIFSSINCHILGGLREVSIFNSSGVIADESGVTWINNIPQPSRDGLLIEIDSDYSASARDGGKIIIADTSGGLAITITLPLVADVEEGWTLYVKKPDGTSTVTVDGNDGNIDGAATTSITAANSSLVIKYTGNNYYLF